MTASPVAHLRSKAAQRVHVQVALRNSTLGGLWRSYWLPIEHALPMLRPCGYAMVAREGARWGAVAFCVYHCGVCTTAPGPPAASSLPHCIA